MRHIAILLAWLAYFTLHSLLAANGFKAWTESRWPRLMPGYRLAFNAIAGLALLPVLWLVHGTESPWLWQWQGTAAWIANGAALAALGCLLASTQAYDMGEFTGLRQLAERKNGVAQAFSISTMHRFVRHPWYSTGLVLIWTRDMNEAFLVSALAITAYLVVGSWLEERKLIDSHGAAYRSYMAAVPGLIPLPWKYLSKAEAASLVSRQQAR